MPRGTICRLFIDKGFGFIFDEAGRELYFHRSWVRGAVFELLREGQRVRFVNEDSSKGPRANDVRLADDDDREEELPDDQLSAEIPYLALALVGSRVRLVSLTKDGTYTFLDSAEKQYGILYTTGSETLLLQRAVEEFEDLINDPHLKESDLQDFFNRNREFIVRDEYKDAHPHVALQPHGESAPLIPDFMLEPLESGGFADLLELKLPAAQVFVLKKNRLRFSAAVIEAAAQAREYAAFFDEDANRRSVQNLLGFTAYRPRVFVILGRSATIEALGARRAEADLPSRITLNTYDDILLRMKARVENMKRGGRVKVEKQL